MRKLHVTQDDAGFWMLSAEHPDGTMQLIAHQFSSPDHLIEDAHDLVKEGRYPDAVVVVDPPHKNVPQSLESWPESTGRPEPRKAGE